MRGEYAFFSQVRPAVVELPPRARRILNQHTQILNIRGTTSACAENTPHKPGWYIAYGNYLRVRGEYLIHSRIFERPKELPPRARRIHTFDGCGKPILGTTSACAENTWFIGGGAGTRGNYLRVRGEYAQTELTSMIGAELPPRARRIPRNY